MKEYFKSIITNVPSEYHEEFHQEIDKENLLRLMLIAALLIISEATVMLVFKNRILNTDIIVFFFMLYNIVFFPLLQWIYKKSNVIGTLIVKGVLRVYLYGVLVFTIALAVVPQKEFTSIHIYVMALFGVAALVYLTPKESGIIFFSAYIVYYFMIPYYQENTEIITVLYINALIMNVIAWVLSRIVYKMRIISFIDKKTILEKNRQLKDMASRDCMTTLFNHENIYKILNEEIERAKLTKYPLSILMIDIDDFKQVNDCYGHIVGDRIIIQVAQTLTKTCRSKDIIGRYGGEEFIIIMTETGIKEAGILADRIRRAIETTKYEKGCMITISGGIMEFHNETAEELITGADRINYEAKNNGKNRIFGLQNEIKLKNM